MCNYDRCLLSTLSKKIVELSGIMRPPSPLPRSFEVVQKKMLHLVKLWLDKIEQSSSPLENELLIAQARGTLTQCGERRRTRIMTRCMKNLRVQRCLCLFRQGKIKFQASTENSSSIGGLLLGAVDPRGVTSTGTEKQEDCCGGYLPDGCLCAVRKQLVAEGKLPNNVWCLRKKELLDNCK
jgi:hypothetical protein